MNPKRGITVLLGNLAGLINLPGPRFSQLLSEKARTLIENFVRQKRMWELPHYKNSMGILPTLLLCVYSWLFSCITRSSPCHFFYLVQIQGLGYVRTVVLEGIMEVP